MQIQHSTVTAQCIYPGNESKFADPGQGGGQARCSTPQAPGILVLAHFSLTETAASPRHSNRRIVGYRRPRLLRPAGSETTGEGDPLAEIRIKLVVPTIFEEKSTRSRAAAPPLRHGLGSHRELPWSYCPSRPRAPVRGDDRRRKPGAPPLLRFGGDKAPGGLSGR